MSTNRQLEAELKLEAFRKSGQVPHPRPMPDGLTTEFWDGVAAGILKIQRCRSCQTFIHVPKACCPKCLSLDLGYEAVSGRGRLYSFAVAVHPYHPALAARTPYVIAIVELEEQADLKIVSNVVDCPEESLNLEMPLRVDFREVAPGLVLHQFVPAES